MAKRRSMTRKQSYAPWSDLNQDVLFIVMMQLGVIDFVAFSGVCKSWRSLALPNRKMFMASRPPISISISTHANEKECYFEGKKFKTLLPNFSAGMTFVGLTCGYLIFMGKETKDFWLVNPIARYQHHFPALPNYVPFIPPCLRIALLLFSPSISGWVFVITKIFSDKIWFSESGKGVCNHVSTTTCILDIHAFKGKIYTLIISSLTSDVTHLYEIRFGTEPKLMLLKTMNVINTYYYPKFVRSDENLLMLEFISRDSYKIHELAFGEMKWVYSEKAKEEYTLYKNNMNLETTAVKQELWADIDKSRKGRVNTAYMWYFVHDCLNVDLIDESQTYYYFYCSICLIIFIIL